MIMARTCDNCGRSKIASDDKWCEERRATVNIIEDHCPLWSPRSCCKCRSLYSNDSCNYCNDTHDQWYPMSNGDLIRAMPELSDQDLAELYKRYIVDYQRPYIETTNKPDFLEWLRQPVFKGGNDNGTTK